ncbi:MAG: hypothetical protein A2428_13130 [Bdellovibrionales bacterium RIFOXYC1_FULL_54_43]|nr:MAG: hypothetical protein A2428_13130 [Bdellovibrionales bacterium RIFOXYC1_FULL_54_43]OFZ79793.1 MAG: hypothetical protein A2603_10710 [Bdellovibrionales bacterium RIFOXYD1_FULL_55_31]
MSPADFVNSWYQKRITKRNLLGQILRKGRRFILGTFRKDYIRKSVSESRLGACARCGNCCKLIYDCPFLGFDHHRIPYCRVYGNLRPANCHVYPFDAIDSEVNGCGYRFKTRKDH